LPAFDLHCPLMSLPLAFGTQPDTVPDAMPYLHVQPERERYWQGRLAPRVRPRIGLVWSGSPTHHNDRSRSIPLARLAGLIAETDVSWISLQTEVRSSDAEALRALPGLLHFGSQLRDFADTAAVIAGLDAVVSVDTSVAHLSGALGQRTMILLPHAADFRWMRGRGDTPWYPTATLLRQTAFGDWDNVIERLRGEIASLALGRAA
jgi:ADP-heptose:LPS heptosyltransferase